MVRTWFVKEVLACCLLLGRGTETGDLYKTHRRVLVGACYNRDAIEPFDPKISQEQTANCLGYINLTATQSIGLKTFQEQRAS